jgi:hypothetical protein
LTQAQAVKEGIEALNHLERIRNMAVMLVTNIKVAKTAVDATVAKWTVEGRKDDADALAAKAAPLDALRAEAEKTTA